MVGVDARFSLANGFVGWKLLPLSDVDAAVAVAAEGNFREGFGECFGHSFWEHARDHRDGGPEFPRELDEEVDGCKQRL